MDTCPNRGFCYAKAGNNEKAISKTKALRGLFTEAPTSHKLKRDSLRECHFESPPPDPLLEEGERANEPWR